MSDTDTRSDLVKQSFLQLPVTVDVERLIEDYRSIPQEAWATSIGISIAARTWCCCAGEARGRRGISSAPTTSITKSWTGSPISDGSSARRVRLAGQTKRSYSG